MNQNINDIIFQDINDEFGWACYGEFKVIVMKSTGYINATKICKDASKDLFHWTPTMNAKDLINEAMSSLHLSRDELLKVVVGGKNGLIRGTYVHPLLIPHIASWASPKFAIKVSKIVNEYIIKEYKETIAEKNRIIEKKDDKIDKLTQKIDEQTKQIQDLIKRSDKQLNKMDHLDEKLDETKNKLKKTKNVVEKSHKQINLISARLDIAVDDRVIQPKNEKKHEVFVILKNNNDNSDYQYYVMCRQNTTLNQAIKVYKAQYPNMKKILEIESHPNSKILLTNIKDRLKKYMEFCGNEFNILTISEEAFLRRVEKINNEKKEI